MKIGIASHPTIIWDDILPWTSGSTLEKKEASTITHTPPSQRRLAKSFSVAPSLTNKGIQCDTKLILILRLFHLIVCL